LSLDDRVIFFGSVPHEDVPPLVEAMDVVLIPRAIEYASPLKLFEYMAARKAIVAARQPNLEEVLTDGTDVLFFAPENQAQLQSALLRLVRDEPLRRRLAAAARHTIDRKNLTWDGNAARIVHAFEEAARRPRVVRGVFVNSNA
jgi:glycosyltransferase involved in cell wall biosynthesis